MWLPKKPYLALPDDPEFVPPGICSMLPQRMMMAAAGRQEVAFPDGVSGLVVRYRADQGITLNGSDVSQWNDLSGNADHLTQGTASDQPLYDATGSPSGDGSVTFDGSTEGMDSGTLASQTQPVHALAVFKAPTWGTGGVLVSAADAMNIHHGGSTPQVQQRAEGTPGNAVSATLGTWFLINSLFNGASSHNELNDDGVVDTDNTGAGSAFTTLSLGREPNASNDGNFEIAEFCLYDVAISGADLTSLKDYFNSRYSLW